MICENCHGEGYVRGKDEANPGALAMLPCLECNGSGIASCCDAAGSAGWEEAQLRAIASYHDDSYPERACDYCDKPYRGPALYCSLACAVADA